MYKTLSKTRSLIMIYDILKIMFFHTRMSRVTATTVKTQHTYDTPGSDRQAIIELLALSQVLLESNPEIRCCIMIKAMRQVFRPYFYLPQLDMLIRIGCDIKLDGDFNSVMGSFILSLIMHHHLN